MIDPLPNGWSLTTLGHLGKWASGGTPSRARAEYYGGTIPWVKTGDLKDRMVTDPLERITEAGLDNSSAKLFPAGTLLIAMYGATIGRLGILSFPAATNQACAALLPYGETAQLISYVFYYLLGKRDELRAAGQGGAQPNISQNLISEFECALPPLNEQRRIVAKLDALMAKSRRAKEALDAIPPLLDKLRQSILAAAFRGDLTADWRAAHPDVEPASKLLDRIRAERRRRWEEAELAKMKAKGKVPTDDRWKAKYQEPKPVDESGLPELPEGWCWASVGDLTSRLTNGFVGPTREIYQEAGVPYLLARHVRNNQLTFDGRTYISEEFNEKNRKSILRRGDVLLVQTGHVGESAVVPAEHEGHNCHAMIVITPITPISGSFLSSYFNSPQARMAFALIEKGMTLRHLNCGDVIEAAIPVPPEPEQLAITDKVDTLIATQRRAIGALAKHVASFEQLDSAILAKGFRGELVPQDPNDEPASVLLERLRNASSVQPKQKSRRRNAKTA
jgi:type I restriction enzyme S subunit